ncbi:hypothetical protein BDF20DRAFT_837062 [Mycotypha africana]|uniref:uncharacterized protein n=1 Tax=Mycotypha africana TaxID=64632 RepID=UPI0023011DE7|nr:uncharacterized protein BDF20DRAFT_837062 [Mycotypha africana]KAI8975690.1 hypothetical protein BDF20DRAFT_837062 [Mycotypha africana]
MEANASHTVIVHSGHNPSFKRFELLEGDPFVRHKSVHGLRILRIRLHPVESALFLPRVTISPLLSIIQNSVQMTASFISPFESKSSSLKLLSLSNSEFRDKANDRPVLMASKNQKVKPNVKCRISSMWNACSKPLRCPSLTKAHRELKSCLENHVSMYRIRYFRTVFPLEREKALLFSAALLCNVLCTTARSNASSVNPTAANIRLIATYKSGRFTTCTHHISIDVQHFNNVNEDHSDSIGVVSKIISPR